LVRTNGRTRRESRRNSYLRSASFVGVSFGRFEILGQVGKFGNEVCWISRWTHAEDGFQEPMHRASEGIGLRR